MGIPIGAGGGVEKWARLRSIKADVHDRRVTDRRLDGNGRGDVDHHVAVDERVGQAATVFTGRIDGRALGQPPGSEWLLDDHVRVPLDTSVALEVVAP